MPPQTKAVDSFLGGFFSAPNHATLEKLQQQSKLRVFVDFANALRNEGAPFAVLPCWRKDETGKLYVEYYAFAFNDHDFRQLGLDLTAFVGPSYSTFNSQRALLNSEDAIDASVRSLAGAWVYKFKGDGTPTVAEKLALMMELTKQRQYRRPRRFRSSFLALRDYYMALEAANQYGAEAAIEDIRANGFLDSVNILFLRTEIACRFGSLQQLVAAGNLPALLSLRRPVAVTESLIKAIYRWELQRFEVEGDVKAAVTHFMEDILPLYADLYQARSGMRSAEAAKSFLLLAAGRMPQDLQLRDVIVSAKDQYAAADTAWIEKIASAISPDRFTPPLDPVVAAEEALQQGKVDTTLRLLRDLQPSLGSVAILCRCAFSVGTLEIKERLREAYIQLSVREQQQLRAGRAGHVLEELLELPVDKPALRLPQNWRDWFQTLKQGWGSKSVEIARRGATEWSLLDGDTDPQEFQQSILEVQELEELRVSLPYLIASGRRDPEWPRPEWCGVYWVFMQVLATYTTGSLDDLTVWADLAESILQTGPSGLRYMELCSQARDIWDVWGSAATTDWILDVLDTLFYYPCPNPGGREALFASVVAKIPEFRRHLDTVQLEYLRLLCADYGKADWGAMFSAEAAKVAAAEVEDVFSSLAGTLIAIYSLTERASNRAKQLLQELCPQTDVRTNADLVATPVLKKLAKEADIFIVNVGSATHAATICIDQNRPAKAVTLLHNGRGSRAMLRLLEHHLQAAVS